MRLSHSDRIYNYCDSCKMHKHGADNEVVCGLTDKKPDFEFDCQDWEYDPDIDIVLKKYLLEENIKKDYSSASFESLIDFSLNESIEKKRLEKPFVFDNIRLLKWSAIIIALINILFVIYCTLISDPPSDDFIYLIIGSLLIYVVLFFKFIPKDTIQIDKHGFKYNDSIYMWRFIRSIYRITLSDTEDIIKDSLIILLESGKSIEFDVKNITFSSLYKLREIISSYRYYGLTAINTSA